MPVPIGLVITGVGTLGIKLLEKLWKDSPEWIDVIKAAIGHSASAISALKELISRDDTDPESITADLLRAKLAEARGIHDKIQGSAPTPEA